MVLTKKLVTQIVFFGFVGGITLLIDVVVTSAMYNLLNLPAYLSSGIGFLSGFFFNFPMNRHKVFKHTNRDKYTLKTQIWFYAGLAIFNLITSSLLVEVFVATEVLRIEYAKILVTAMIAAWNFIIFKTLIFSKIKD